MNEMKVSHFLCRKHFERTLDRKLADDRCKQTKKHLYDALYFRKIDSECEKSFKKAMNVVFENKREYIERE